MWLNKFPLDLTYWKQTQGLTDVMDDWETEETGSEGMFNCVD